MMSAEDSSRLLDELDMRELFERHADLRVAETLGLSVVTVCVAAVAAVIATTGLTGAGLSGLVIVGVATHWAGDALQARITWAQERASAALRRLGERQPLPPAYLALAARQAMPDPAVSEGGLLASLRARLRPTGAARPEAVLRPLGLNVFLLGLMFLISDLLSYL